MKLLLDQNLSRKLVKRLAALFPGLAYVAELRLDRATDRQVWEYARDHGFVLVSKDSDMVELSLLHGTPPKIVWLRLGNVSTASVERALIAAVEAIEELSTNETRAVLSLIDGPSSEQ